jgi:tetratricopeptide (TPR) repeat protein
MILGAPAKALLDFDEAVRLAPDDAAARFHRGRAHEALRQYGPALDDIRAALARAPDDVQTHNQLAWLLCTCPDTAHRDGPQAVEHATRACALSDWADAAALDTLATAYAECGDFGAAVRWAEEALTHAGPEAAPVYRERLARLRAGEPPRE